jgi:hypothetical protein
MTNAWEAIFKKVEFVEMGEILPLFSKFSVIDIHIDQVNHFSWLARKLSS